MKEFDILKWIRQVRDRHYEQQQDLSVEEKLERTRAQAEEFRASRREKNVSSGVSENDQP